MSGALALVMTEAGPVPTPPVTIRTTLVANVAATNPGYTSNLPGSLVEDVASTDTGAIVLIDLERVEFINSITPFGANAFLLNQLGQIYGVPIGQPSNTSAVVVFSGTVGFPIPPGFLISDGSHQYAVTQRGGIINSGGSSAPLIAVATQSGSWAVPASSVTTVASSVPTGISLTVTNPNPGIPGADSETESSYRTSVLAAGLVASAGMPTYLKTLLKRVSGVVSRLVGVRQVTGGWQVIVGGSGDPYEVAYAVFRGVGGAVALLKGSLIDSLRNITTTINDYPDTYTIITISPPSQTVNVTLVWNTSGTGVNFVSGAAVASLGIAAIVNYINSIPTGASINLFDMERIFQDAVASVLPPELLTRMVWSVEINSSVVLPISGTGLIEGDPESFFTTDSSKITVTQG